MILAGIDEAGYGPLLGPLTVGCCAIELVDVPAREPLPCLWQTLRRVVSKTRSRDGRKLHVNDSKLVYSSASGIKELERSILTLAATLGETPAVSLDQFFQRVSPGLTDLFSGYRWYGPFEGEKFPLAQDLSAIRLEANSLAVELPKAGARIVHLGAQVLLEKELNHLFDKTRNKSSVLFTAAAGHIDHLLRNYSDRGLVIYCDRQGGREHYGHLLRLMFEDWSLEVAGETEGCSEYRLTRSGRSAQLIFREKAETFCMSVAVASMLCKYLRESLMSRFNAWWLEQLPGLQPTAGYYTDGMRFLKDTQAIRTQLGITDAEMIRSR